MQTGGLSLTLEYPSVGFYHSWRISNFMEVKETSFCITVFSWSRVSLYEKGSCRNHLVDSITHRSWSQSFSSNSNSLQQLRSNTYCSKPYVSRSDKTCWIGLKLCKTTILIWFGISSIRSIFVITCPYLQKISIRTGTSCNTWQDGHRFTPLQLDRRGGCWSWIIKIRSQA